MERSLEQVLRTVAQREAEGGNDRKDVPIWVRRLGAPVTHRFAAGDRGVTSQDVTAMISKNKDLLDKTFQDCTPLDLAIASNNTKGLETLLQMGADPNSQNGLKYELFDGLGFPGRFS